MISINYAKYFDKPHQTNYNHIRFYCKWFIRTDIYQCGYHQWICNDV